VHANTTVHAAEQDLGRNITTVLAFQSTTKLTDVIAAPDMDNARGAEMNAATQKSIGNPAAPSAQAVTIEHNSVSQENVSRARAGTRQTDPANVQLQRGRSNCEKISQVCLRG
jgi:hypothetical protein